MKEITLLVNQKRGNDQKRGRSAPFRTLTAACAEAKEILKSKENVELYIALTDPVYTLDETISFEKSDFRSDASSITFYGAGTQSLITGNREIPGSLFTKVEGKPYYMYQFPDENRDENGAFPAFRDFYFNGRRAALARIDMDSHIPFPIPDEADRKSEKNSVPKLYLEKSLLEELDTDTLPLTELWIKVEWQIHCLHIAAVERRDRREGYIAVHIVPEEWSLFVNSYCRSLTGRPCWLQNNIAFLNRPNEFYYDQKNGRIYYYPENEYAMGSAVCAYSVCEKLFDFNNVSNISFENLAFTGTTSNYVTHNGYITGHCGRIKKNELGFLTDAAIHGAGCKSIRIDRCRFYELGADALNFNMRTENLTVLGSVFTNIGASAIRVGSAATEWNEETNSNKNIIIENNLLDGTGLTYTSSVGIFVGKATRVQICHNTVKNSCYSAISVGWSRGTQLPNLNHVEISYNYIDNFMFGMRDGGAICTLGSNSAKSEPEYMNFMHHNYMVVGPTSGQNCVGYRAIYHDVNSSHWRDSDNVILAREEVPPSSAFIFGGSYCNLIERTCILNYSLPFPPSVEKSGEGNKHSKTVLEKDTVRGLSVNELPPWVQDIILSTGCSFDAAPLPSKRARAHTAAIRVCPESGNDRHSGLSAAPCKTLEKAVDTLEELLSSKRNISVTILLEPGEYTIEKTLKMDIRNYISEDFEVHFVGSREGETLIYGAARQLFQLDDMKNISFENISFQGRNASVGSAILSFRNASNISICSCNFNRINANAVLFSGVTKGVTVIDSVFSHIGGAALRFGSMEPHSDKNGTSDVTVRNNLFEYIGYVISDSAAILSDVAKNFFVRQNSFHDLSYEAVRLGTGKGPLLVPFGYDYNVFNTGINGNYIADYCTARGGAAIRVIGGNCTPYHHKPFNFIFENYIKIGEKTGNETSEFMVFSHEGAASQWHTHRNCIMAAKHNESALPLAYLSTDPNAYSVWIEGNFLFAKNTPVFVEPMAIADKKRNLHDKDNRILPFSEVPEEARSIMENAGCDTARPDIP